MTADVVVIGAGFAGLSAAVKLAESGLRVVVAEEAPRPGGRATAFTDRATGERVDNGQHVLFGCYRDTFEFLGRIGSAGQAPLDRRLELTMVRADERPSVLSCPSLPPPWHLIAGVMRWRALSIADRLGARKIAGVLRAARRDGPAVVAARVGASDTVSSWLAAHGQSARICEWLWHPLAIAALNQSPEVAAAGPFVRVLCELFGPRATDSAIALPRVPLDELYAVPAARFIEARGGSVQLKSPARIETDRDSIVAVQIGETTVRTARVVSSVPWHALGRIWKTGVPAALTGVVADAERMASSPIVTVNLWFDRPVMSSRFVGFVGGEMHWAFDKSAIFGTSAGHISIVSSGADGLVRQDNATLMELAVGNYLERTLPAVRSAKLLRSVVVREPRATFSLAPGGPPRPGPGTALRGFYLAGDWTDTGLPGTIEGAVVSGHKAAEAILRDRR
jgi:squalene-associated FAD-dependent desaturase